MIRTARKGGAGVNGAESLLTTANATGTDVCFANPGTTEMPLVEAFDTVPGVRTVLGLSEGVVTGAADGHARMTGAPAMTLLHLGPGLANGIANLHNARRARTPVVNVVGEHASWHQHADPPLASDIESLARPVSGWVGRTGSASSVGTDFAECWHAARSTRLPATLIAASDHLWSQGGTPAAAPAVAPMPSPDAERVDDVAKTLTGNCRPALLLGGTALTPHGVATATRIAEAIGGRVLTEGMAARIDRDPSVPQPPALPYFPEDRLAALDGFSHLVLVGSDTPVSFFGYPGMPSTPVPEHVRVLTLATPDEDAVAGLDRLAEATSSTRTPLPVPEPADVRVPDSSLDARALGAAIVTTQPPDAIVVNEGVSASGSYPQVASAAPAHTQLSLTGGAIGAGIPLATGAAVACPDRPVIDLQADGSGFYTVQGLWTQVREGLNVTTVICANRRYRILEAELDRSGVHRPGPAATGMTSLDAPEPDWTALAAGFGVPASSVSTGAELADALKRAHAEEGPHLIEALL